MDSVNEYLDTDLGIKKIHPSMKDYPSKEDPLTYYNKGCGENGSVFCHANTWAIIAECMLKDLKELINIIISYCLWWRRKSRRVAI